MTKPYLIAQQPVVSKPIPGMDEWIRHAVKNSNGVLWNNGSWVVRDVRGKPGIISNHARGLAVDLSYRWMQEKQLGCKDGEQLAMIYLNKLLQNADTLGIALVINYSQNRSWKCDRGTWLKGKFSNGDWLHVEVDHELLKDVNAVKTAWNKVFSVIPQTV